MTKLTIDTASVIEIMTNDRVTITEETRAAVAILCGVGAITDNHLPRAIHTLRPWLAEQLPWLDRAVELVEEKRDRCQDCVLEDEEERYTELCPVIRLLAALIAMFGASVEIEPLPVGAYQQPDNTTYLPDCNRLN